MDFGQWVYDVVVDPFVNVFRSRTWWKRIKYTLDNVLPTAFFWFPVVSAAFAWAGAFTFTGAFTTVTSIGSIPLVGAALGTALGTFGTWITTTVMPFLLSGIGAIPFVGPAITGALGGLLASNPIGWGIIGVMALPAVTGGLYEMFARIIQPWRTEDNFFKKLSLSFLALIPFGPINFVYGFCRTTFHLATGKGYIGSLQTAIQGTNIDLTREAMTSDAGGGSLFRIAVPPLIDRLIAPAIGAFSGLIGGAIRAYREVWKSDVPGILKVPAFILVAGIGSFFTPFIGFWRGLSKGSQAAFDTAEYIGFSDSKTHTRNVNTSIELVETDSVKMKDKSSCAKVAQGLREANFSPSSARYEVANRLGKQAANSYEREIEMSNLNMEDKTSKRKVAELKSKNKSDARATRLVASHAPRVR